MNDIVESRISALWTFMGTSLVLVVACFMLGGLIPYWELVDGPTNIIFNPIGVCIGAVIISALAYLITMLWSVFAIYKQHPGLLLILHAKQNISMTHFLGLVVLEEIIARWLFLGVLPEHLPNWCYIFLLFGGSAGVIWFNAKQFLNMSPRLIELFPQWVAGFLFAYIFVEYGLFASIMTHLGGKSLLMTLHKVEDDEDKDMWAGVASLVLMLLGFCYFKYWTHKNIWAIQSWADGSFKIEGWNFFDYFIASIVFIYGIRAISLFFGYDQGMVNLEEFSPKKTPVPIEVMGGCFAMTGMTLVGYGLLCPFVSHFGLRTLLLTSIFCMFYPPDSGSGRVRNFWTTFVAIFVSMAIMQAVGAMMMICYMLLHLFIQIPFRITERYTMMEDNRIGEKRYSLS